MGITTQFALSDPLSFLVTDDVGRLTVDNGWPNIEARIEFGLGCKREIRGKPTAPFRIGLSSVIGQIRTTSTILAPPSSLPPRSIIDVWGVGTDLQALLGERNPFVGGIRIRQYLQVPKDWDLPDDSTTRVLARVRGGDPLVIEKPLGDG